VTDVAELALHHERLNVMEVCFQQDLGMWDSVLPRNADNPLEVPYVKDLKEVHVCPVKCPHLATKLCR